VSLSLIVLILQWKKNNGFFFFNFRWRSIEHSDWSRVAQSVVTSAIPIGRTK
jgi:hypothetical protein